MTFVATGKRSAKDICNGEYKQIDGLIFTILAFSIFTTS
jgi:hypothetical protein